MVGLISLVVLSLALVLVIPAGCAILLRWARAPGWAVLGGVIGGILLGPTVFGRLAPVTFESMIVGGVEDRQALRNLVRRQGADLLVAEQAAYGPTRLEQIQTDHALERAGLEQAWTDAKWDHQRPLRLATCIIVALVLLGAGPMSVPRSPGRRDHIAPISIGLWSAGIPGALAYALGVWWWRLDNWSALLIASAVAIGPWVLTKIDLDAADDAELGGGATMQAAGRVASIIALAGAVIAVWRLEGGAGLLVAAPLLALPLGWLIAPASRTLVRQTLLHVLIPAMTACIAIRIELYAHLALWLSVVLMLISGDGRWTGAYLGTMLPGGRRSLRTMRLVLGSMAAGPTQLAVTAVAVSAWLIDERFALALLLGAVYMDVSAPLRHMMAGRLVEVEKELDELREE